MKSIRVNTVKKAKAVLAQLRRQGRYGYYDIFWTEDGTEVLVYYR